MLDIILQDLKELDRLLRTFSGKDHIPEAFIHLAQSKVSGIANEVDLLGSLAKTSSPATSPVPETQAEEKAPSAAKPSSARAPEAEQPRETASTPLPQPEPKPAPQPEAKPEPEPEPEPKKEKPAPQPTPSPEAPQPGKTVLGELLGKDRTSFNEKLGNGQGNGSNKLLSPVSDLRKALGINDRFFFQRELFNGSSDVMNQTLDQLNQMDSLSSAKSFIAANFKWQSDQEAVHAFMDLLERRFHQ